MTRPASLRKILPGRRLGDPVDLAVDPNIRAVRGRLAAVSVRASVGAGAWVGFALGLVIGMIIGGILVWFAGAVLDWQRDLAFTFGVARRLLPFGDQLGLLRDIQTRWWAVVPLAGLTVAVLGLFVGGLLGGILGAAYNRSPRHALVVVELPRQVAPLMPAPAPAPGAPADTGAEAAAAAAASVPDAAAGAAAPPKSRKPPRRRSAASADVEQVSRDTETPPKRARRASPGGATTTRASRASSATESSADSETR